MKIRTIGKPGGHGNAHKISREARVYKIPVDDIHTVLGIYKELVCTTYAHVCAAVISVNYYRTFGTFLLNWHREKIRVNAISLRISGLYHLHFSVSI